MKNLIYFFLLFSSVVFSQNYNYALGKPKRIVAPTVTVVNNQLEEIEYFKAYLLPITKKATLQVALDTYGSVRLEKGDYSGVNIIMKSNQRLYGHPTLTKFSNIVIAAGSVNIHLEDLLPANGNITFQSGAEISGCTFKNIKYTNILGTNVMVSNCTFLNIIGAIRVDNRVSGYFRNNKIIKHQAQGTSNQLVLKGNSTTPSYGNVHLHSNYLTPGGDTTDLEGLQSATFVGIDSEGWNMMGEGTKAMFTAKNMGNVKISDLGGNNGYSQIKTGAYDIDATDLFLFNCDIGSNNISSISPKTNLFGVDCKESLPVSTDVASGFDLLAYVNSNDISFNGSVHSSLILDSATFSKIKNAILGVQYIPWARPKWEALPDPLGANWRTERVGKTDSRGFIQNLIDTKGIAELPEGVFYISSTLNLPLDSAHGIIGKGTGKTVIVGLTDDFPIITLGYGSTQNFTLNYLTLQGGSVGVFSNIFGVQIAYQNMKFVVFRDQNIGIHLRQIMGLDNNFFEHIGFVNCNKGFFQDPLPTYDTLDTSTYVDKTVFYQSQFINCSTSFSMRGVRANNLNAWIDCNFDGGKIALDLSSNNFPIVANCDFKNFTGSNVISSNTISIYNSNFYNNAVTDYTIKSNLTHIEGCNLLDSSNVFSPVIYNPIKCFVFNSTITGNVITKIPQNLGYYPQSAIFSNSTLIANPTLSKLLVNVKAGIPTVIINANPNPYPQLLVTQ